MTNQNYKMSKALKIYLASLPPEEKSVQKKLLSESEQFASIKRKDSKVKPLKSDSDS
jgi:hypothetical protein